MDWPECEEFYNLMQAYRHAPISDQGLTISSYEAVKEWIRENANSKAPICEHCDHPVSLHEKEYGCEYEKDVPDSDIGWRAWRCGCTAVVKP